MASGEPDPFAKEQQWRRDVRAYAISAGRWFWATVIAFLGSLWREGIERYRETVGTATTSAAAYGWAITTILAIIAGFRAWTSERRKVEASSDEIKAKDSALEALKSQLSLISAPRFEIECGEATTMRHGTMTRFRKRNPATGEVAYPERVGLAFFGFRLWNRGASIARKTRATLVEIRKEGRQISSAVGALPFEAKNQGDDLEEVDVPNNVPQPVCVFSIFHNNEIAAGSGNAKWRHAPIDRLFDAYSKYEFVVAISCDADAEDGKMTQYETFVCDWKGDYSQSTIEYTGTNKYRGV